MTEFVAAPEAVDLLVVGAHVLTLDAADAEYPDGAVAVRDARIVAVGPTAALAARYTAREQVDGRGMLCLPGLIDAHLHIGFPLVTPAGPPRRPTEPGALAAGGNLDRFLAGFARLDAAQPTPEETHAAAMAALLMALRGGATCVNDGGFGDLAAIGQAIADSGLRGAATYPSGADLVFAGDARPPRPDPAAMRRLDAAADILADLPRRHGGRVRGAFNVLTDLNGSDEYWLETKSRADALGLGISSHVATVASQDALSHRLHGAGGFARLDRLGVLGPGFLAVHAGFPAEDEIALLVERGVAIAHCPGTSMGAGKGILADGRMRRMAAAGIPIAIATDTSGYGTIVQQMQLAFYGHKEAAQDDTVFPADAVLAMVTRDAARALLWDDEIGALVPGRQADLTLLRIDSLRYAMLPHPLLGLLRSGHGGDVDTVIVAGRVLLRGGAFVHHDEPAIIARARAASRSLLARV